MGRIVIVVYRPFEGKEAAVEDLVKSHHAVLQQENLATARKPMLMKTQDGCIVEVFEWVSANAVEEAHSNINVGELWAKFNTVYTFEKPVNLDEFQSIFSEFESIN